MTELHMGYRESESTDNTSRKECDRSHSEEDTLTAGGVAGHLSFHPYLLRRHLCSGTLASTREALDALLDPKAYPAYGYYPLLGLKEIIVTRAGHTGYQPETLPHTLQS